MRNGTFPFSFALHSAVASQPYRIRCSGHREKPYFHSSLDSYNQIWNTTKTSGNVIILPFPSIHNPKTSSPTRQPAV